MLKTHVHFQEPVTLVGEGQYNIDDIKEISATESYLGMDQSIKACQKNEPVYNCTTRHYLDTLLEKCGCLPLSIRISDKVTFREF